MEPVARPTGRAVHPPGDRPGLRLERLQNPLANALDLSGVATALPFTLGIIMLGLSSALFGTKVDSNGPRWAMVVASSCFVAGFLISGLGLYAEQYWLVVLGYGFVGGIGLASATSRRSPH